jgi:tetratricopeptide (TPR) repeat protein
VLSHVQVVSVVVLAGRRLSPLAEYARVATVCGTIHLYGLVVRFWDPLMMMANPERWFVLVLLTFSLFIPVRLLDAAPEGTTKAVAIIPFTAPAAGPDREWLSDGIPHVLALRLQQLPQVKVAVLSRSVLSGAEGTLNPLDNADAVRLLERLRPLGYDALIVGHFMQFEPILRAEIHVWAMRPERHLGKAQEQAAERDPDSLGIKLATFVVSALQVSPADSEGRRFAERYTTSAEAFERFARALSLAETSDDEEEVAQAVNLFKEATKLDGKFAMALRQQGDLLFRRGHYGGAVEAYQSLVGVGRRSAAVYHLLGNAYFAQHDAARALDAYKRGLQLDARDYQLHLDLGLAYAALKDYASATKTFLRALEVKPNDPLAFANLGVVYLLQGNFLAATASLRRALLLQGSDPVLNYNLGLSLMFEQAYDQARDQFERALQLKPDFAAAAYHLALLYERFDSAQALERWRKYLALAREKPGEDDWVAWAEEHLQRLQQP